MSENILLYVVLLSQILLISLYFPKKVLGRVRHVIEFYPLSQYPKLYPVSLLRVEKALRNYKIANLIFLLMAFGLLANFVYSSSEELLNLDSQSILGLYFILQSSPILIILKSPGFTFFNPVRELNAQTTRATDLKKRRLFDFISPALLGLAIAIYLAFILFVVIAPQLWTAGYWNIAIVTAMNLVFGGAIAASLHGKTRDPYQAYEDRLRRIKTSIKISVFGSIAGTVFLAITVGLQSIDSAFPDIAMSLYFQIIVLANLWTIRIDNVDFEIYKGTALFETRPENL